MHVHKVHDKVQLGFIVQLPFVYIIFVEMFQKIKVLGYQQNVFYINLRLYLMVVSLLLSGQKP